MSIPGAAPARPARARATPRVFLFATLVFAASCGQDGPRPLVPDRLPERLDDSTYWSTIAELSEPGGYFRSENFLSNERQFQYVIPRLTSTTSQGGVYLGVGPEQNFTYIAALHPKMAIIVDIRRQNMIQHLMYKALFELSADRAEFVSRLFSRARPPGLDTATSADSLFDAYGDLPPSATRFEANLREVSDHLVNTRHFPLDSADLGTLRHVYETFYVGGPDIDYNFPRFQNGYSVRRMPSYLELMIADDGEGVQRSYLANETNFRLLKSMHERNVIIPVVGDFSGPKALRAVGKYLKDRDAVVTAVYTSNVEQYLFQPPEADKWRRYYESLGTLPFNSSSTFIRSIRPTNDRMTPGIRLASTLSPIEAFLAAFKKGRVTSYDDVADLSKE